MSQSDDRCGSLWPQLQGVNTPGHFLHHVGTGPCPTSQGQTASRYPGLCCPLTALVCPHSTQRSCQVQSYGQSLSPPAPLWAMRRWPTVGHHHFPIPRKRVSTPASPLPGSLPVNSAPGATWASDPTPTLRKTHPLSWLLPKYPFQPNPVTSTAPRG